MNHIAIGSDRDVEYSPITVNNFKVIRKPKYTLSTIFEISDLNGNVIYNCKFNPLGLSFNHKIENSDGKTIAKINYEPNDFSKNFILHITVKNNNENKKEEKFSLEFKKKDNENPNNITYALNYYNKAIEAEDILEINDKTYIDNNKYLIIQYNVYHGSFNTGAPLVCRSDQTLGTTTPWNYSVDVHPGTEPILMLIIHFGILINNIRYNSFSKNPFNQ